MQCGLSDLVGRVVLWGLWGLSDLYLHVDPKLVAVEKDEFVHLAEALAYFARHILLAPCLPIHDDQLQIAASRVSFRQEEVECGDQGRLLGGVWHPLNARGVRNRLEAHDYHIDRGQHALLGDRYQAVRFVGSEVAENRAWWARCAKVCQLEWIVSACFYCLVAEVQTMYAWEDQVW